jgi:hypothetical protein
MDSKDGLAEKLAHFYFIVFIVPREPPHNEKPFDLENHFYQYPLW